jgi:hypothetical protein
VTSEIRSLSGESLKLVQEACIDVHSEWSEAASARLGGSDINDWRELNELEDDDEPGYPLLGMAASICCQC